MVAQTRRISPGPGLNVGTAMSCARPVRPAWSEPSPQARSSTSSLWLPQRRDRRIAVHLVWEYDRGGRGGLLMCPLFSLTPAQGGVREVSSPAGPDPAAKGNRHDGDPRTRDAASACCAQPEPLSRGERTDRGSSSVVVVHPVRRRA